MSIFSGLLDVRLLQVIYSLMDNAEGGCLCFQFTRGRHFDFTILSPFLKKDFSLSIGVKVS